MNGPFNMTQEEIKFRVPAQAGAYVLGNVENRALYVGRSASDLRAQLLAHFAPAAPGSVPVARFWFEAATNPWAAYLLECTWYHQFSPTHNAGHPARPLGTSGCHLCGQ